MGHCIDETEANTVNIDLRRRSRKSLANQPYSQ